MDKIKIYGLHTNVSDEIRYVGKTKKQLKHRLREHILNAKRKNTKTHKENWIRKTLRNNEIIQIILLEECAENEWQEKEIFWIKKLQKKHKLTNSTKGGEGGKITLYKWSYNKLKKYIQINFDEIKSELQYQKKFTKNFKKNKNIPTNPQVVYKNRGWISWGDFLGTNVIQSNKIAINKYISYKNAKKIINKIKINSIKEYRILYKQNKIPMNIPQRPERFYAKRGWISWGDFLGTQKIANQFKKDYFFSFEECKKYLNDNFPQIDSTSKFLKLLKSKQCSDRIPTIPSKTYKDKWISFGDFIGTNRISDNIKNELYYSYNECVDYINKNLPNIKSSVQWKRYWQENIKPNEIPLHPDMTYKKSNEWHGWGKFLNTNNISNSEKKNLFLKYQDFVNYFKENCIKINSAMHYRNYYKINVRPLFIPASPDIYYRNKGWSSWNKFIEYLN